MSPLGVLHTTFSFVAVATGAGVMLIPKGTRWHRTMGHLYATTMLGVIVTAFTLFGLLGGFSPFHFAAIVGLVTLAGGMYAVLARRPKKGWIEAHAIWMSWSYIGLLAAFAAESLTRFVMPRMAPYFEGNQLWGMFWTSVAVASLAVFVIGSYVVKTRLPAVIARTPQVIRRERRALEAMEDPAASKAPAM